MKNKEVEELARRLDELAKSGEFLIVRVSFRKAGHVCGIDKKDYNLGYLGQICWSVKMLKKKFQEAHLVRA